jgi:hypothetical protein
VCLTLQLQALTLRRRLSLEWRRRSRGLHLLGSVVVVVVVVVLLL